MTPPSPTQPTPTASSQQNAPPQPVLSTGLYEKPEDALKVLREDFSYWTGKLTESSFALSLAVIGANWAVFGSFDKIRNNTCAELSIAAVLLTLVISLIGHWYLGEQLRKRIAYAEEDAARWQKEFDANAGKPTPWPLTRTIDNCAWFFRLAKMSLPMFGGAFFVIAFFTEPNTQQDKSHSGSSASPTRPAYSASPTPDAATASFAGATPSPAPTAVLTTTAISTPNETETKGDAETAPTPEPTEDIEEMNDWRGLSPDETRLAVTRIIPDSVLIQRHDLDGLAVAIVRLGDEEPGLLARHDFQRRIISQIEWSPDSKFLLFTTASSGGHSPWHAAAFLFCTADNSFRDVDAAIGSVVSPKFRFEPPDIALMTVKKGEAPEEEVKVSIGKTMHEMPRVK